MFAELRAGTAWLYAWERGFIVFKVAINETGVRDLLVWLAFSQERNAIVDLWEDVSQIARDAKCAAVQFTSLRKGFERVLGADWEMTSVRYRRAV